MSLTIRCTKHPRYKAKLPPKASCDQCIELWQINWKALAARLETDGASKGITQE